MTGQVSVSLPAPLVGCGEHVRAQVYGATDGCAVVLRCHLDSAEPVVTTVASQPIVSGEGAGCQVVLAVPDDGPISARGTTLAVSWTVALVDPAGTVLAISPVVVTPRGGVALWLQRHAPPPL